jgi:hypothetical protein
MPFGIFAFGFSVQQDLSDGGVDGIQDAFVFREALVRSLASVDEGGSSLRDVLVLESGVDKCDVFLCGFDVRRP